MNSTVYVLVLFQYLKVCHGQSWTTWGEHRYFWSGSSQTFTQAQITCTEIRGPLASIHSADEQSYINGQAGSNQYWIGLQTTTLSCDACSSGTPAAGCTICRNNWDWIDGSEMIYQNWQWREPTGGNNCVRMRNDDDGKWADANGCNSKHHVLCKRHLCSPELHISCGDHFTCRAANGSARCICEDGYGTPNCTDIDECDNDASCLHGVCQNTVGSFVCQCHSGYEGHTCNTDIDECMTTSPCGQGTCRNNHGSYTCECFIGYEGEACDTDIDECMTTTPCGQGTCRNHDGSYTCECPSGYEGEMCDSDIDECTTTSPCGHGTCRNNPGSYRCECPTGYEGETCHIDVDECSSMICQNGGTCDNLAGSFDCFCQLGITGSRCETNIDNCVNVECNHGTCVDEIANFTCQCEQGYKGRYCDVDIDYCIDVDCNHGTCVDELADFTCECEQEFQGRYCNDVQASKQKGNPSSNEEQEDLWIAFYVGIAGCCVAVSLLLYFLFTDHTVKKTLKEKFSKNKDFSNIEEPCVNESALHPNGETPM